VPKAGQNVAVQADWRETDAANQILAFRRAAGRLLNFNRRLLLPPGGEANWLNNAFLRVTLAERTYTSSRYGRRTAPSSLRHRLSSPRDVAQCIRGSNVISFRAETTNVAGEGERVEFANFANRVLNYPFGEHGASLRLMNVGALIRT
jgi:hypothetical protein